MQVHEPAVVVRGLTKHFRDGAHERVVLASLDFEVPRGSVVAVWGPSGVGKSTLLNLLAGLIRPDAGEILVRTVDAAAPVAVHRLSAAEATRYRRRYVGYVFQAFNLVPTLTVAENVRLPLALNDLEAQWPAALARLQALGLESHLDAFPETLSGGERQRVAIARALAHGPALLLADEPTGNLDADNAARVGGLLFAAARAAGATLFIATHNLDLAAAADQRIDLTRPGVP